MKWRREDPGSSPEMERGPGGLGAALRSLARASRHAALSFKIPVPVLILTSLKGDPPPLFGLLYSPLPFLQPPDPSTKHNGSQTPRSIHRSSSGINNNLRNPLHHQDDSTIIDVLSIPQLSLARDRPSHLEALPGADAAAHAAPRCVHGVPGPGRGGTVRVLRVGGELRKMLFFLHWLSIQSYTMLRDLLTRGLFT